MNLIRRRFAWVFAAAIAVATAVQGQESLSEAYSAILRGDYKAGESAIARMEHNDPQVSRLSDWLRDFRTVVDGRSELKQKTFNWNVEHARQAFQDGKIYLALNFAAQAIPNADDENALSNEPWVKDLTEKALAEAERIGNSQSWTRVRAYYVLLSRIHPNDKQIEELRDRATRHARLEVLYDDREAVDRRTQGVSFDLLRSAVRLIDRQYYTNPDFKAMGAGALDYMQAMCDTPKLFDVFDGLGNPVLRAEFAKRIKAEREELGQAGRYNYKDLLRLYGRIAAANTATVELPEGLLIIEFLEGGTEHLDDFTSVVWPADVRDFDKMMRGDFEGVGIQLGVDEVTGRLKVVTPLENSPALEAGIHANDLIVEVDGTSTKGWNTDDAIREITGPSGSIVNLTMFRPSSGQRLTFPLKRRQIQIKTVRGVNRVDGSGWNFMLDEDQKIAYIRLTGFQPESQHELLEALENARNSGMQGLVLDLRYNPGGLLDVAIETVNTFLDEGDVVSTRGRREANQHYAVDSRADFPDVPVVVLVNDGSASASEILAGALKDNHRAVVLGDRTFGKGSVQRVLPLGESARLKLTTALYYLPSGRSPHKLPDAQEWGVDPDLVVKLTPKETLKILESERESYIIHNVNEEAESGSEVVDETTVQQLKDEVDDETADGPPLLSDEEIKQLEADPYAAPASDPQLQTALLLLRTKLAANLPWPRQLAARPLDAATTP